jgi:hypothetical protein
MNENKLQYIREQHQTQTCTLHKCKVIIDYKKVNEKIML